MRHLFWQTRVSPTLSAGKLQPITSATADSCIQHQTNKPFYSPIASGQSVEYLHSWHFCILS